MYTLLALASALLFGIWQYGIGRYRGDISAYSVVMVSATMAGVVYLMSGIMSHALTFDRYDMIRGVIGGALNVTGTLLVLKAFETGPMGVVTGVAASSTLVPLAYSLLTGEPLTLLAAVGVLCILVGLAVFYAPSMKTDPGSENITGALVLALLAALAWGVAIVALDLGARVSVSATMLMSEVPQVLFTLVMMVIVKRTWGGLCGRAIAPLALAGVALALGQLAFFTAAEEGDVGVVSVLGSLSPIVTAVLAYFFLKESMNRSQRLALLIVLIGTGIAVV